jgi:PHD/YefM family antitoxin component YafN of YafNO toxin-antitoxin module
LLNGKGCTEMLAIKKEYIITENNKKKAVLVDLETFNKMEELIEDYGLGKFMDEVKNERNLTLNDGKKQYQAMKKG